MADPRAAAFAPHALASTEHELDDPTPPRGVGMITSTLVLSVMVLSAIPGRAGPLSAMTAAQKPSDAMTSYRTFGR